MKNVEPYKDLLKTMLVNINLHDANSPTINGQAENIAPLGTVFSRAIYHPVLGY